ncbi:hypothetical protein [Rhodococcoides fascians]|uniref:hypothetical protein n=1 Tax=Rhodococcoides fascians TaxID=1828 RepID=UPI001FCA2BE1|nr:hypothetical protein [Rhodococcus fascians]
MTINPVLVTVQIAAPFLAAIVAVAGVYLTIAQKDRNESSHRMVAASDVGARTHRQR